MPNVRWEDWIDPAKKIANRHPPSDIRLKNHPHRSRPIEGPVRGSTACFIVHRFGLRRIRVGQIFVGSPVPAADCAAAPVRDQMRERTSAPDHVEGAQRSLSFDAHSRRTVSVDWNRSKGTIMKLSTVAVALGLAAATMGASSYAGDHHHASKSPRHADAGMRTVPVSPRAGEPGHGWRYYSDARKARAVVISPNGDYYYSHGEGPKLVFKAAA